MTENKKAFCIKNYYPNRNESERRRDSNTCVGRIMDIQMCVG